MSINFENLPAEWGNEGVEPSTETKNNGFSPGDKPPAAWINWQFNKTYKAIDELQDTVSDIDTEVKQTVPIPKGGTGATTAGDALANLGAVPTTRKINNKPLNEDISLTYSDVGAAASEHNHSANEITSGTLPISRGGTGAASGTNALKNLGIIDLIYPVGSIYMSVSSTSPATLFGGTWERLKDRFLLGAGDTFAAGTTGGERNHTLTINEMPSHNHNLPGELSGWGPNVTAPHMQDPVMSGATAGNQLYFMEDKITGYTGGGAAHNNMPPYLAVYMWKRTA